MNVTTFLLTEWPGPPPMEAGAPEPVARQIGTDLRIAYRCRNPEFPGWRSGASPDHPGFAEFYAVIRMAGVRDWILAGPSEETLVRHPLAKVGVKAYGFYRGSLDGESGYVITFHDATLQVKCADAEVIDRRLLGNTTSDALTGFSMRWPNQSVQRTRPASLPSRKWVTMARREPRR
jgi:hypothetical protein